MLHHGLVVYAPDVLYSEWYSSNDEIARADAGGSFLGWDDGNEKMNRSFTWGLDGIGLD